MAQTLQRITLPDQAKIWAPSAFETAVLYREIVTQRTYQLHGIRVDDGAVVFDIGANVGLFGVHLARTIPGVRIHAFEPIPDLFEALSRNLAEHAPDARAHNVGIADRAGEAVFEVDRFATMAATMHPDVFERAAKRDASAFAWASAGLADVDKVAPQWWTSGMRKGLTTPGVRVAALLLLAPFAAMLRVRKWMYLARRRCPLQTLSAVLTESGESTVDLVKIDVEGAEEEVLAGIAEDDWGRLRQFVIEVMSMAGSIA
jgi:FkbM family methyltransferase